MTRGQHGLGVILTGGTIGSIRVGDGPVRLSTLAEWPERSLIEDIWAPDQMDVSVVQPFRLPSEELRPEHWLHIHAAVQELLEGGAKGILIFHGTDTACYTTAALSFLVGATAAPVVVTGSNHPLEAPDSDGPTNIMGALTALRHLDKGVFLSFAGVRDAPSYVHLGTRVRKSRASGSAFESVNFPPVARVGGTEFEWIDRVRLPHGDHALKPQVDHRVLLVQCYPGMNPTAFVPAILGGEWRGVILELYASATGPVSSPEWSLAALVEVCVQNETPVFGCVNVAGDEELGPYESTLRLQEAGMVFLPHMLPEVAVVKLMLGLGQGMSGAQLAEFMRSALAGELGDERIDAQEQLEVPIPDTLST